MFQCWSLNSSVAVAYKSWVFQAGSQNESLIITKLYCCGFMQKPVSAWYHFMKMLCSCFIGFLFHFIWWSGHLAWKTDWNLKCKVRFPSGLQRLKKNNSDFFYAKSKTFPFNLIEKTMSSRKRGFAIDKLQILQVWTKGSLFKLKNFIQSHYIMLKKFLAT